MCIALVVVAQNPNTSPDVLTHLAKNKAKDKENSVIHVVAENTDTTH
jgi:hypothetical protein